MRWTDNKYFVDGSTRENKRFPNYFQYFCNMGSRPSMPVIFLFDNELESKRPLKKFVSEQKISDERIAEFKENLHLKLQEDGNAFLLTNPLVDGEKECEIEQLFLSKTLSHEIDGRKFCPQDQYDTEKYYGKEIFSQYIASNYNTIDFSRFRPLLSALDSIMASYASSSTNQS